jgi:hypothetical protein
MQENMEQNIQENTQNLEKIPVDFSNIGLGVVVYDPMYFRNQGTISQIILSLQDMALRLIEPSNKYQEDLYPKIRSECTLMVDYYNQLVGSVDSKYFRYFGFYLNGPNNDGKRKPTTTLHERKRYNVSEFKETLKSVDDRLRHIKNDCIRKSKSIDPNLTQDEINDTLDNINTMIDFCDDYHKFVNDRLHEWNNFVNTSRNTNKIEHPVIVKNTPMNNNLSGKKIVVKKNNESSKSDKFVKPKVYASKSK